jgi:hypothetical protein
MKTKNRRLSFDGLLAVSECSGADDARYPDAQRQRRSISDPGKRGIRIMML